MRSFFEKKRKFTVWGMVAAICISAILPPMGQSAYVSAAQSRNSDMYNNVDSSRNDNVYEKKYSAKKGTVTAYPTSTASPAATTSGGGIASPTPKPTPTPLPVVTAKPKADIYLKNTPQDIILTVGAAGEFDLDWKEFTGYELQNLTQLRYRSADSSILQMTSDGGYRALKAGHTTVTVTGWDGRYDETMLERTYTVYVYPDMSGVSLSQKSVDIYVVKNSYSADHSVSIDIKGGDTGLFDEDENEDLTYEVTSSNKKMYVSARVYRGKLILSCSDAGTTTVTFRLYDKEFQIQLKVSVVEISDTSVLLVRHKTKKLKIKGYSGKIQWRSSHPKVASVSGKGKVRGKKEGNTIISAKIGDIRLGCVISVTTAKKKKVIRCARRISSTGQYSQPKRMLKGYYDCSSLVWRSYSKYGVKFGASSYAPTAAGEAEYLARRHKLLKGGFSQKNASKLKFKAGDLMFETGASNGRYKGIYHVEMIIGYEFYGWDENNKPVVAVKWANRPDGHYGYGVGIVGKM